MLKVFISSTALDLKAHREAVREALMRLQMHPVMMEDFNATDAEALAKCQREVVACDVFIGLYAYRYGYIPPNQRQSITELEYEWATEKKIPRLIFMVDSTYDWNQTLKDTSPTELGLLTAFKKRLDTEKVRATFTTPHDLATKVVTSLAEMEREGKIKPRQQRQQKLLALVLGLLILVAIGSAVTLNQWVSNRNANQRATREFIAFQEASQTATGYTPTPTPCVQLQNSSFNVAITEFWVQEGTALSQDQARQISEAFSRNFAERIDEINGELSRLGGTIGIWSPQDICANGGTTLASNELGAQDIIQRMQIDQNARVDLLVYGTIQQNGDQIEVSPSFYNAYTSPELTEVYGRFDLEAVLVVPGELATVGLNAQLTDRAEVLALITQGIFLTVITPPRYESARASYEQALSVNPDAEQGKELIYVLMGNASMSAYNRLSVDKPEDVDGRQTLLEEVQGDFENAVALNDDYARAYVGLGAVLYQKAVMDATTDGATWSAIPDDRLQAIAEIFQQAVEAEDTPPTADIPTKINFGLGQVALFRFLAGDSTQAEIALAYFEQVIDDYGPADSPTNPRVREFTAQAYGFMGLLYAQQNQIEDAILAYDQAIELTQLDVRRLLFQRSRWYLKIEVARLNGDIEAAMSGYTALFKLDLPPDEAATAYYRQGKMLSESGRNEEALQAYLMGTELDTLIQPMLAAQLWVEVGNKRYDLGDLQEAIDAYAKAIALDPTGQAHLQTLIEKLTADLRATTTPSAE